MPVTVWQILNVMLIHLAEMEILKVALKKSWNHIKQIEVNLFLAGFIHLESLCDAENLKLHL